MRNAEQCFRQIPSAKPYSR